MAFRKKDVSDFDADFLRELKHDLFISHKNNAVIYPVFEVMDKIRIYNIDPDSAAHDGFVFIRGDEILFDSNQITIYREFEDPDIKKPDDEVSVRDAMKFSLVREIEQWEIEENWKSNNEYYDPFSDIEDFMRFVAGPELSIDVVYYKIIDKIITPCLTHKSASQYIEANKINLNDPFIRTRSLSGNHHMVKLIQVLKRVNFITGKEDKRRKNIDMFHQENIPNISTLQEDEYNELLPNKIV